MAASDVNSNYNSGQLQLTKRTGFLTTSVAYTYSKYMGMAGGVGDAYNQNGEPECPYTCLVSTAYSAGGGVFVPGSHPVTVTAPTGGNGVCTGGVAGYVPVYGGCQSGGVVMPWNKYYYGLTTVNATHIIAMSFTVDSPWGKGMTGFEGALVKGWSVTGVVHYQTGPPNTVTDSVNVGSPISTNGFAVGRRASIIPGQPIYYTAPVCTSSTHVCWANPGAFAPETALAAGDAPIGDIVGPAFYQWDMSVRKTFILPWREGMSLQLQGDAFNAFNQTNWQNSFTSLTPGNANFGQISTSQPSRLVQIGGKFNF